MYRETETGSVKKEIVRYRERQRVTERDRKIDGDIVRQRERQGVTKRDSER